MPICGVISPYSSFHLAPILIVLYFYILFNLLIFLFK